MPALVTACGAHPSRPGIGVCRGCGVTICDECATRDEGILRCRVCHLRPFLPAIAAPRRTVSPALLALVLAPAAWLALAWVLIGAARLAVSITSWTQSLRDAASEIDGS